MTISVHDLPPGNRPVDVVASNRQLPSLVPHKRELHKVSQPIEQAPQKYFFSFFFCRLMRLSGTRWTTSGACSQWTLIWRGWSSSLRWRPRNSLFTRRRLQFRCLPSLFCNIYFCVLDATQLSNANDHSSPIFVLILSSTLRRICLSGPRGIQASLTPGTHNNHKVGIDCYQ